MDAKQVQLLCANYHNTANAVLCALLHVSTATLMRHTRKYGLKKTKAYKQQIQAARMQGRKRSAATKEKIAAKARGRIVSKETIAKILATKLRRGTLPKGEKHPNWKGGRPWARFRHPSYKTWRTVVLVRDDYICQDCHKQCKKREKGLAAHHIKEYALYPELRYDVDNGVTLCRRCHMLRHGKKIKPVELHLCECGCGTVIPTEDPYGRPRRFMNFHYGRLTKCGRISINALIASRRR